MRVNIQKIWVGIAVVIFLLTGSNTFAEKETRTMLQVSNLSCGSCLARIDSKLKEFSGYEGIAADLRRGLIAVDHRASLESEKIAAAITEIGYPATIISENNSKDKRTQSTLPKAGIGASCCGGAGGYGGCGAASSSWKRLFNFSSD